jgi:hypothetical protein
MVRCALWLENRLGLETLDIGRQGLAPEHSCTLQICGRQLFYSVTLDRGFLFGKAHSMDSGEALNLLLTIGDTRGGGHQVCSLVRALEQSGISNLSRPIELGTPGSPDSWVIDY